MSNQDEVRDQLHHINFRLAALRAWEKSHGKPNPHLKPLEEHADELRAQLRNEKPVLNQNLDILRAHIAEVQGEMRTIHAQAGERKLNPAQEARWQELETELDECLENLKEGEENEARANKVAEFRAKYNTLQVGGNHRQDNILNLNGGQVRSAALRVLDDKRSAGHLKPEQLDHVEKLIRSTDRNTDGAWIATAIALTETPEYRSGFARLLCENNPVLSAPEAEALRKYQSFRAASLTDSAGGYGVPALADPAVILTSQGSLNPVRRVARNITITGEKWYGVSSDGVTWSWDTEAAQVSDDAPTLSQPVITPHKAQGFIPYSIEIAADYGRGGADFANEMARMLAEGYDELLADALINGAGDGSNTPVGIVTALAANTWCHLEPGTDGAISFPDIHKVWSALPDRARANAYWLMNPQVASYLATYGDTYGSRTVSMDGTPRELRGRPIIESSKMPTFSGTTGAANILICGDFQKYVIVNRAGMSVEVVPHLFGNAYRPTGQRGLYAWARVGADSVDDLSFRMLRNE